MTALTPAERQRKFRLSQKGKARKLEMLLPDNEFLLLHDNAKKQELTKAKYIISLLHGNGVSGSGSTQIEDLLKQVEDLTKKCRLDKITIKRLISEKTDPTSKHPDAINLINENKELVKENKRLTKKANEEHISRKEIENKYNRELKGSDDELQAEIAAMKNQIKKSHNSQEYAKLESKNKLLVSKVAELEAQQAIDQASIAGLLKPKK